MKTFILFCLFFITFLDAKNYTDMLGREVEVNSTQKLVFLGPGALRMGVYLGLQDRLVGIERTENTQSKISPYRSYLGKSFIAKLPVVSTGGPGKMPNLEALIVHKPDLIITSFLDKTQLELIRSKTSIPVLSLSYGASYGGTKEQLESMKNSILLLGEVSGKEKRARKLVDFIEKKELELSKIELEKKCVYVGGIGYKGKQGITSTEANYPPFELLGLKNCVFKDSSAMGHHFIDYEALLSVDPEMIFVDMFGKDKVMLEQKEKSNFFKALSAYKNKNIKDIHGYNFYATNIENLFVIAYQIASYMGAKNIDVDAKAKEIYDAFYIKKGSRLYESASSL